MMKLRMVALAFPLVLGCSSLLAAAAPQQAGMNFQQALNVVAKAGYKNIHKIERDMNCFEVTAFNADGKPVHLKIDPMTGAVTTMQHEHHAKKHHTKHHRKHHMKHHVKHHTAPAAQ